MKIKKRIVNLSSQILWKETRSKTISHLDQAMLRIHYLKQMRSSSTLTK